MTHLQDLNVLFLMKKWQYRLQNTHIRILRISYILAIYITNKFMHGYNAYTILLFYYASSSLVKPMYYNFIDRISILKTANFVVIRALI